MKSKIICLAAAIAAAGAITAVAVAQSSGDEVVNESIPAVESAVVSDEAAESDVPEIDETVESTPTESDDAPEPAEDAPESTPAHHEGAITAVDPVDGRRTYTFNTFNVDNSKSDTLKSVWSGDAEEYLPLMGQTDSSEASLKYLEEFFGTDILPVDEQFRGDIKRRLDYNQFVCDVTEGAKAYSPVEGIVIAASPEPHYNNGLGAIVAVEFDNKIFIIAHLDEVHVEVGDTVSAGQALGVCGHSGHVYVGDPPLMTLIPMIIED